MSGPFTPGQVLTAAQLNAAVPTSIATGTSPDAGDLTGGEQVTISRGGGVLQKTLSGILAFGLVTYAGFSAAGAGAAARPISSKLQEWVSPEDYFVAAESDQTGMWQRALAASTQVRGKPGSTYTVTPQSYATPEGGTGICINVPSNTHLILDDVTIIQRSGTTGTGAIIGNSAAVSNVVIEGGLIDGNQANTTGNMCTLVLWNATDCTISRVRTQNNRFIGVGFRASTSGYGRNLIADCKVFGSLYIGISCNDPSLGLTVRDCYVTGTTNNAYDIEGNNPSGDPSIGSSIKFHGNTANTCLNGLFMESVGEAIITGNDFSAFTAFGYYFNRTNSGSYHTILSGNKMRASAGAVGVIIAGSSGIIIIQGNMFDTLTQSVSMVNSAQNVSIGPNQHRNISGVLINVPPGTNQLIRSRIASQDYVGGRVNGVPFTCSPLSNPNNSPGRAYLAIVAPMYSMDDGTIATGNSDSEYVTATGALTTNVGWGAYAIYSSGKTFANLGGALANSYIQINGTMFWCATFTAGGWQIQNTSKVDGDYTSTINGAYPWTEYYPQWQTG